MKKKPAPTQVVDLAVPGAHLRWINEAARQMGKKTLTELEFYQLATIAARIPAGRRSLPVGCKPTEPLSIRAVAKYLKVDGKSTRFIARFIDTGRLAADRVGKGKRWRFDRDELDRAREAVLRGEF